MRHVVNNDIVGDVVCAASLFSHIDIKSLSCIYRILIVQLAAIFFLLVVLFLSLSLALLALASSLLFYIVTICRDKFVPVGTNDQDILYHYQFFLRFFIISLTNFLHRDGIWTHRKIANMYLKKGE